MPLVIDNPVQAVRRYAAANARVTVVFVTLFHAWVACVNVASVSHEPIVARWEDAATHAVRHDGHDHDAESSGPGIGYMVTTVVCDILFGVLASIVVAWFARQREFRADAGAALRGR